MDRGRPTNAYNGNLDGEDSGDMFSSNSPLPWQKRPASPASDHPPGWPLSTVATENGARSYKENGKYDIDANGESVMTRDQIAHSLSSKDPAWFRQTADHRRGSPAYRRHQVEEGERADHSSTSSRTQLSGMSREISTRMSEKNLVAPRSPSISPVRNGGFGNSSRSPYGADTVSPISPMGSPIPLTGAQRFDPPGLDSKVEARGFAMSPTQGRISPDRLDRPISPTKGMGGFVQSAMMKRSDSVNKRWNVQSPPGLNRGNSVASNRSSKDSSLMLGGVGTISSRPSSPSKDYPLRPPSRPGSSHSNATITQDPPRPGTSSSMHSSITTSTTDDTSTKPLISIRNARGLTNGSGSEGRSNVRSPTSEEQVSTSPSKTMDPRRWSPTKASWLENALNKPESPKPKASPVAPQPSWMTELNKAKSKDSQADSHVSTPKHEVNIGGLMRSPPLGTLPKSITANGGLNGSAGTSPKKPLGNVKSPSKLTPESPEVKDDVNAKSSPVASRPRADTPPKQDFRSALKPRQLPPGGKEEPEFKNVFGQLRKTKTQNYVAPDELKNNILRGKAALNVTGGPKKTERVDEFKDAILKKKEDFKKAQSEGRGVARSVSGGSQGTTIPEAIAKRKAMGRSDSNVTETGSVASDTSSRKTASTVSDDFARRGASEKSSSIVTERGSARSDSIPSTTPVAIPKWKTSVSNSNSTPTIVGTTDSSSRTVQSTISSKVPDAMPKWKTSAISPTVSSVPLSKTPDALPKWKTSDKSNHSPIVADATVSDTRTGPATSSSKTPETVPKWKTSGRSNSIVTGMNGIASDSSRNVPTTTPEDVPKWKASAKDSSIGTKALTSSPPKVPPTTSPIKETSAPGRLQGKRAIGSKLASRVNPALAEMLTRGPPSVASNTSRSASAASSQRTASISTSTTDGHSAEPIPQLTHMTKSRARGPRRKAPSSVPLENSLTVVEDTLPTSELLPAKAFIATPKPMSLKPLQEVIEQVRSPSVAPEPTEEESVPPTVSPWKQDVRTRSLQEVSIPNGKAPPSTDSPKMQSPIKKFDLPDSPLKSQIIKEALASEVKPVPEPSRWDIQNANEAEDTPKSQSPTRKIDLQEIMSRHQAPSQILGTDVAPDSKLNGSTPITQGAEADADTPKLQSFTKNADAPLKSSPPLGPKDAVEYEVKSDAMSIDSTIQEVETSVASLDTPRANDPRSQRAITPIEPPKSINIGSSASVKDSSTRWASPAVVPINMIEAARVTSPIRSPRREDEQDLVISGGLLLSSPIKTPISPEILFPPVSPIKPTALGLAISGSGGRSLPSPPTKAPISPPQSANGSAIPQTSEASWLVAEFFGGIQTAPKFVADTATVLSTRPEQTSNIKTVRSTLFQLFPDGKKQQVPSSQERLLFEGGMYLCVHSFKNAAGKNTTEVYYWSGDSVPVATIEETAIFAQREARSWSAGGKLIKVQQGKEPLEFLQALGGIIIIRRGSSNKYDSLAPHILCARQQFGSVIFDEVDFTSASLCSGFPFLISTQSGKCYLWKGKGSGVDELSCARLVGMDFGLTGEIEEVDDGKEPESFLRIFGRDEKIPPSADHWRLKPKYNMYCGRLFQANSSLDNQVRLLLLLSIGIRLTQTRSKRSRPSLKPISCPKRSIFLMLSSRSTSSLDHTPNPNMPPSTTPYFSLKNTAF